MAAQPSDDAIIQFMDLTALSWVEARARLAGNNNDLSQAMNEYFDNPGNTQYRYDESAFGADRDGMLNHNGPSFQIQTETEYGNDNTGGYLSSAPSRPPSRTNNHVPMGEVVSLAAQHAAADPYSRMDQNEMMDPELQKAIEESKLSAGMTGQQEYGTIDDSNQKYFGPANQNKNYDSSQWGMVHVPNAAVEEVEAIPDPVDRKREDGFPAFLRPSSYNTRLPALITILHEIPLIREVLLDRDNVIAEYGFEKKWWEGVPIPSSDLPPRYDMGTGEVSDIPLQSHKLIHESQRLMAFLDQTDRSYGSADSLYKIVKSNGLEVPGSAEISFFEEWKKLHADEDTADVFFSVAVQPGFDGDLEGSEADVQKFSILDVTLPAEQDAVYLETLYDLADFLLWRGSEETVEGSAYMSHIADIFCFRLSSQPNCRPVQVPLTWYPDRYLEASKQEALEMRLRKAQTLERLKQIIFLQSKLTDFQLPSGEKVKVEYLLNRAIKHAEEPVNDALPENLQDSDEIDMTVAPRSSARDLAAELKKVVASIDRKMKELQQERENATATLRQLSTLFTKPTPEIPLHPYTLRGVSATKNITFICRSSEPDLIDIDLDATGSKAGGDQWWKITFSPSLSEQKPVKIEKVSSSSVLEFIATSANEPTLIYASDHAVSFKSSPLPPALDSFIRAENLSFSQEFPNDVFPMGDSSSPLSPKSPGKRKLGETDVEGDDSQPSTGIYGTSQGAKWSQLTPSSEVEEDSDHVLRANQHRTGSTGPTLIDEQTSAQADGDVIMGLDPTKLIDLSDTQPEQKSLSTEMKGLPKTGVPNAVLKESEMVGGDMIGTSEAAQAARRAWGLGQET